MDIFVDEDEGLSIEELAETMHEDYQQMTKRDNYEWKQGDLRPQDYKDPETVEHALRRYAPPPITQEIEASFGDQEAGTHVEFSYNVRHISFEENSSDNL